MFGGGGGTVRKIATVLTTEDRATPALQSVEEQGTETADSLEETEERAEAAGQAFKAMAGVTTAAVGALGLLARQHGQTEQTFARLQTVVGATNQEMEQLRSTAIRVGKDLPVAVGDAAGAMEQLAFAGYQTEEAIAAAQGVAELATASSLNMQESARTTSSALRMFNLEANETHQVTASLSATFSNSATNIRELGQALEYTGTTAQMAGVSLHEITAAAGLLADQGIRASKAGTALNTTLQRLMSGSGQAEEALSQLGLSISDLTDEQGELRDMEAVFGLLSRRMDDLGGRDEQMGVATQLAGRRGSRALLNLVENSEKLNEKMGDAFRSEIQESIGELSRMNDEELSQIEESLGMGVGDDFTADQLVTGLREMNEAGMGTQEMTQELQESLNLSQGAAEYLAEGASGGVEDLEAFSESIGGATTASKLAASQMDTAAGSIQFLRSSVSAFTLSVYSGAAPAITLFNEQLAAGINVINENRAVGAALGGTLVAVAGAAGTATVALGAMVTEAKLAALAEGGLAASTTTGTAALKAKTLALFAANKAQWLATASTSALATATKAQMAPMWFSARAHYASATAALADASAKGVATAATSALAGGFIALQAAMGPVGWLLLAIAGAGVALAAVWKGDLFNAGSEAGAVLGFFSDKAGQAWLISKELIGILYELTRIGATIGGLALVAPFAAILKLPGFIRDVGPEAKEAAMGIPPRIVEGLAALGPGQYAIPILGPMLLARDIITDPDKWLDAGQQIPLMLAEGIANTASKPVDEVAALVSDTREFLPFSPAERGALQDLDHAGPALVSTIADGVESEAPMLTSTLDSVLMNSMPMLGQAVGSVNTTPPAQSSQGGKSPIAVTINQEITVEGDGEEAAEQVAQRSSTRVTTDLEDFFSQLSRET